MARKKRNKTDIQQENIELFEEQNLEEISPEEDEDLDDVDSGEEDEEYLDDEDSEEEDEEYLDDEDSGEEDEEYLDDEDSEEEDEEYLDDEDSGEEDEEHLDDEDSEEDEESDSDDADFEEIDPEDSDLENTDDTGVEVSESEESEMGEEDEEEPVKKRRRRRGRRAKKEKKSLGKKPWIIAGSILGALVVIYLGISAFFIGHFFVNTTINGKDFSGKTVEDVEQYMKEQVANYELTLLELNNMSDVIRGSDISLVYEENSDIEDALNKQNPLLWVTSFFSTSSSNVTIEVSYDEQALEEKIQSIRAVQQEQTDPVSAYPKFDGNLFVVEPEVYGTAVDMDNLTEKIKEYITEFRPELDLLEEECYKMPKYTSESPEVQEACDAMNEYLKASITYPMTENVVVDKTVISGWLSYDDNMQVTLNEDAVREWMRQFGATYDTVGATRTITTPSGKTTEVSGGTYGWSIDEETETQNLIASIKNGEVVTREPVYTQTAASHSAQDWGATYIEVDLTDQYMWYIVDGAVAFQAYVVTGLPTPDRATPAGVYSILYTERNAILRGERDPATGKPSYETPVSFWMPFTWQGHGFHDATWQPGFGGSLYQTIGSHGCVNMSYSDAQTLFNMISAGTPVVLHY